jgi:hypothetical protein
MQVLRGSRGHWQGVVRVVRRIGVSSLGIGSFVLFVGGIRPDVLKAACRCVVLPEHGRHLAGLLGQTFGLARQIALLELGETADRVRRESPGRFENRGLRDVVEIAFGGGFPPCRHIQPDRLRQFFARVVFSRARCHHIDRAGDTDSEQAD